MHTVKSLNAQCVCVCVCVCAYIQVLCVTNLYDSFSVWINALYLSSIIRKLCFTASSFSAFPVTSNVKSVMMSTCVFSTQICGPMISTI